MSALDTDLYELTMSAGYFLAGKTSEIATFELSVRRLPQNRNFLVAAGLAQAVEYLQNLKFKSDDIEYLRGLTQFRYTPPEFFKFLLALRFTGDLFAVPEGTPVFPNEPVVIIRAPIVEAQIAETYLLSTFAFQTSIASKAARCVLAACGHSVVEFGSRRAHGPEAGILAARAAYLGGCSGTSNAAAGKRFNIPVSGTAAHSWTMSFESERAAFVTLQNLLGENTVFLLDTYDTIEAAHLAAALGQPLWGVRLDSGDLLTLSREVRHILDAAGLESAKIFVTNDLDEHRIAELLRVGAPIDVFGVGTQLSTSADAPALAAVYKLVELNADGRIHYTAKFSDAKNTRPGAKQIYRFADHDLIALQAECGSSFDQRPLLRPILSRGELVEPLPDLLTARAYAKSSIADLPSELRSIEHSADYRVDVSTHLSNLTEEVRRAYRSTP